MELANKTENSIVNQNAASSSNRATASSPNRNLGKNHLGGIIFGCKNSTMNECLYKQLFGLPAQHFSYVKNIDPGLPLFLFNYSDRKLHGIFEAVSSGQMNINPYAWTNNGSETTQYPAQVQIRVRLQCQPLFEDQFKPIISDNYYTQNRFCFELDHVQTSKLISLLSSSTVSPSTFTTQNTVEMRTINKDFEPRASKCVDKQMEENNKKDIMFMKLKELVLTHRRSDSTLTKCVEDNNGEITIDPLDDSSVIAQLIQGVEELKAFKKEQIHKTVYVEEKLVQAEAEIRMLKDRCMMLESLSQPSMAHFEERIHESTAEIHLDLDDWIFLVGGYNGSSYLSSFNCYSPSHDVIKSLRPMNSVRSYPSVASLNSQLYVFGGGDGNLRYDTVESYDPAKNEWKSGPSLREKKGSLAGATLEGKIFAIGGGNGREILSDVEMLDLEIGRWILTRSMLQKRFALAVAELNGALYAVGGYDGNDYLKSAERFDPREHSWTRIENMNTKRSDHSLAVMNEKLYAVGGHDGSTMVQSVEIYDPRRGSWMLGDPMVEPRGYPAAVVLKDSIYALGGVKANDDIIDMVEHYKEGEGWRVIDARAIGRRGFFSAIVL